MDIKSTIFNRNDTNSKDNSPRAIMHPEISNKEKALENPVEKNIQKSLTDEKDTYICIEIQQTNKLQESLKLQSELNNHINFVKLIQIKQNSNKFIFLFEKQNHLLYDFLGSNQVDFLTRLLLFKQCFEIIKILKKLFIEKFKFFNMMNFFIETDSTISGKNKTPNAPILKLLYNSKIIILI